MSRSLRFSAELFQHYRCMQRAVHGRCSHRLSPARLRCRPPRPEGWTCSCVRSLAHRCGLGSRICQYSHDNHRPSASRPRSRDVDLSGSALSGGDSPAEHPWFHVRSDRARLWLWIRDVSCSHSLRNTQLLTGNQMRRHINRILFRQKSRAAMATPARTRLPEPDFATVTAADNTRYQH